MTGPEHYKRAEEFLAGFKQTSEKHGIHVAQLHLQAAQVHATLALGMANVLATPVSCADAWAEPSDTRGMPPSI